MKLISIYVDIMMLSSLIHIIDESCFTILAMHFGNVRTENGINTMFVVLTVN